MHMRRTDCPFVRFCRGTFHGSQTYRIGSQRLKAGLRSYDPVAVEQKARELDPDGQITEDALVSLARPDQTSGGGGFHLA